MNFLCKLEMLIYWISQAHHRWVGDVGIWIRVAHVGMTRPEIHFKDPSLGSKEKRNSCPMKQLLKISLLTDFLLKGKKKELTFYEHKRKYIPNRKRTLFLSPLIIENWTWQANRCSYREYVFGSSNRIQEAYTILYRNNNSRKTSKFR